MKRRVVGFDHPEAQTHRAAGTYNNGLQHLNW